VSPDRDDSATGRVRALLSTVRFGQFLSVGVVGAICDNAVLVVAVRTLGVRPVVAKLASAEAAIALMFLLNERWTFAGEGSVGLGALVRRFVTSNVVRAGGAATALVVLYLLTNHAGVWYLVANVIGMGLGFGVNYTFETLVTWRVSG
jgi:putative flippase GtrA